MMDSLREHLKKRAGIAALATATLVFGAMSLARPKTLVTPAVRVPIVQRFVPRGGRITSGDIVWVSETRMRSFTMTLHQAYARVPLLKGEVLTPAALGNVRRTWTIVAIAPNDSSQIQVARLGGLVDVLVTHGGQVLWQSGAVVVVGRTLAAGLSPSISVAMSLSQALAFEREQSQGTIALVGMGS